MKRDDKLKRGLAGLSNLPIQKGVAELRNKLLAGDPARHTVPEEPPSKRFGTPTDSVGVTDSVRATESVTPTESLSEPQRRVGVTESVRVTDSVGVRVSSEYFRAANAVFDRLLSHLSVAEQIVYIQLYRLSWGHQRTTCRVSVPKLASRCNMGTTVVRQALRKLEQAGHLTGLGTDFGASNKHDRGLEYRVNLPEGTPTESVGATRSVGATESVTPTHSVAMKYIKKEHVERAPVAVAPAPVLSVYDVRKIAARFVEAERGNQNYTRGHLRADVRRTLLGEGHDVADSLIDEAIGH